MADPQAAHKEVLEEILNRKKLGDKKFHSETSLQNLEENEEGNNSDSSKDPGVSTFKIFMNNCNYTNINITFL